MIVRLLNRFVSSFKKRDFVVYPALRSVDEVSDVLYRTSFYFPDQKIYYAASDSFAVSRPEYLTDQYALNPNLIRVSRAALWWKMLTLGNVLVTSSEGSCRLLKRLRSLPNIHYVDRRCFIGEAMSYYQAHNYTSDKPVVSANYLDLDSFPRRDFCFVFGSGPSLNTACDYDFQRASSYKIICNSLVKNHRLLDHIRPDFIVCADAAFHFGPSVYAGTFRKDLVAYLSNNSSCKLLIPDSYYAHFRKYVYDGPNLYTIPCFKDKRINIDLRVSYGVHNHGSILNRLQLPLAFSLSDQIMLLGFDGRSKEDQSQGNKIWTSHSADNNYLDLMHTVFQAHPHIRSVDKDAYASRVAAMTETIISLGEQQGREVFCISESNVPALLTRQIPPALKAVISPSAVSQPEP